MTHADFDALTERFLEDCLGTRDTKGNDYAEAGDRLANFKEVALATGITPFQVWSVYAGKHTEAIRKAIKRNPEFPTKKGEPIQENIKDVIVYHLLLLGLVEEYNKTVQQG